MPVDLLIPIIGERSAAQEGENGGCNPVSQDEKGRYPKCNAEILDDSEYTVVQQQKRDLGQGSVQEVQRLNADKRL